MATKRKYSIEDLREAVSTSDSIAQVLEKIGLIAAGGNYASIKRILKENDISIDHFSGMSWAKGRNLPNKRPIEDYLNNIVRISSYNLKRRLLKEGLFEHKCNKCENETWNGEPIPLELEHKDGCHENNSFENLELLCPNCHAQTDTYRGKNIKFENKATTCEICEVKISKNSKRCMKHREDHGNHTRKVDRPALEDLKRDIEVLGYCGTGRKYGVSDNAIRKWVQ